ncbi:MAG: tetratricopeptide repeat protein, partial [Geitlerinemataceae cyanobacterium]
MDNDIAIVYFSVLIVLLAIAAVAVLRQALKTRRIETRLVKIQKKAMKGEATAKDYYELGGIFLDKKLYIQSIDQLQKALKAKDLEGEENIALVYNALGFAYACQQQYDLAIRHYKDALKLQPAYVAAWNNLAFSYERKNLDAQALEAYEKVLEYEPKNAIAKKR